MRMTKKVLSIVLAVMMVVSMMSVMAVSANAVGTTLTTWDDVKQAAQSGGYYELGNDIEYCPTADDLFDFAPITVNKDLTIDGNGYSFKAKNTTWGGYYDALFVVNKFVLTLKNVSYDGTAGYDGSSLVGAVCDSLVIVKNDATATLRNVTTTALRGKNAIVVKDEASAGLFDCSINNTYLEGDDIVIDPAARVYLDGTTAKVGCSDPEYNVVTDSMGFLTATPKTYVAQIGDNKYETLEEAFAAAVDGDKIEVLADCAGNGIKVLKNTFATGLTVDFGGHTYTVDGETVGSPGTETLAFQLQYGNNITFKNGTLYSEKAKMLVQNYSNLTLDGMTLTFNNTSYNGAYTLSNNNGNTVIKDTTINANPTPGSFAFDVCRGGGSNSYPSVNVTVTGNSVINGNVEVYAKNADPKNGFSLKLLNGTMTGNIVVDPTAKAVLDAKSDKGEVTKDNAFGQKAPEGLVWEDNGDGTSSLVPVEVNPLDALITKVSDGNKFGITSQYYAGTILGVQKKDKITNAGVTSDKGTQEAAEGSDMRFVAVLDTEVLRGADDYGFVLAKVGSDKNIASVGNEGLDKLKKGDDRFKTISAVNTYNTVCGTSAAAKKYGDPTDATTAYKYITCAVNGVDDSSKIVARFYVVKDGKTYYGKYAGHSYKYRGAVAGMSDLG